MAKTICIDPGHGGIDPGATYNGRKEADDNLRMSLKVESILKTKGHRVVLTHRGNIPSNQKLPLDARRKIAFDAKADIFVSFHRNSIGNATAKGTEVWIRYQKNLQAATDFMGQYMKEEHQANRGIKIGNYAVLYNMPMPAMLLETGFISNPADNALFDKHLDDYALVAAKGLLSALGEPWGDDGAPPEEDKWYRLQLGAFESKENADNYMKQLKEMGLPVYPVYPDDVKEEGH